MTRSFRKPSLHYQVIKSFNKTLCLLSLILYNIKFEIYGWFGNSNVELDDN